jgi:hypothetical protein
MTLLQPFSCFLPTPSATLTADSGEHLSSTYLFLGAFA